MNKSQFLLIAVALLSVISSVAEEKLRDSRVWHGKNGKHFRGQFVEREGDAIRIIDTRGKLYKVPLTALSEDDLNWFEKAWANSQQKENRIDALVKPGTVTLKEDLKFSKVAPIGYEVVAEEKLVRANLPVLTQSEYHDEDFNNMSSSLVPFFLWWHNYKVVSVESRRDDNERRIKWLYKELNDFSIGGRRIRAEELEKFCKQELKTKASFETIDLRHSSILDRQLKVVDRFSPQFLSQYTKGANATILSVRIYQKGNYQWTADVPLVDCTPDGKVTFYMYGDIKLTGKLEKLPFDEKVAKKLRSKLPRYEIKVDNMGEVEQWFQDREYTFFLEGGDYTGLVVIKPYKSMQLDGEAEEDDK